MLFHKTALTKRLLSKWWFGSTRGNYKLYFHSWLVDQGAFNGPTALVMPTRRAELVDGKRGSPATVPLPCVVL